MPIKFACPNCRKKFQAKDEFAGKKMKCSSCGNVVRIPAAGGESPQKPPEKPIDIDEYSIAGESTPASPAAEPIKPPSTQRPSVPRPKKKPAKAVSEYEISFEKGEKPLAKPAAGPSGGRICPGCKKEYPPNVKICVQCGINLLTGKKLQTETVSAEEESTAPIVGALLPGEEMPQGKKGTKVGKEIPFFKVLLNIIVNPIKRIFKKS